MSRSYIGLGSNLDDPQQQIKQALAALAAHPDITLIDKASLYGSKAVGPGTQPDYVNTVALVETTLSPVELLKVLQAQENLQGRRREQRWGPRTLDLDILSYDDIKISTQDLTVPHPRIMERSFVLKPLSELRKRLNENGDIGLGINAAAGLDCPEGDDCWRLG